MTLTKVFIALILLTHCSFTSVAQINFVPDSNNTRSFRLDSLLDLSTGLDTSFDFQFRLWRLPSFGDSDVFVLSRQSSTWQSRYFELRKGKFIERAVNQNGLDSLWSGMVYHQVLTLPDQGALRSRMRKYSADTSTVFHQDAEFTRVTVTDGTTYQFELIGNGQMRIYRYHCPAIYLKHYPNIEALYRAYAILIYIGRYLGYQHFPC